MTRPTGSSAVVLSVGETLIDIIEREGEEPSEHVGGSLANVALTLGRLGQESHLLTYLGDDERGRRCAAHLAESNVHLVDGSMGGGRTSTAKAKIGETGAATYVFDLHWELPDPLPALPEGTACLHTGSIAAVLQPGGGQVLELIKQVRHDVTISYDPNMRPAIMEHPDKVRDQVEALVAVSDVVKLSDEDAEWFAPDSAPEDLAQRWVGQGNAGPSLVVITRGGHGAVGFTRTDRVEIASLPVSVVDTVGAGDTFSSGLIDGLAYAGLLGGANRASLQSLSAGSAKAIMEHAARLAAVTVSRAGANTPWRHEVYPKQAQV